LLINCYDKERAEKSVNGFNLWNNDNELSIQGKQIDKDRYQNNNNYLNNHSFSHFNRFSYKNSKGTRDIFKLRIEKRFESPKIVKGIHTSMLKKPSNFVLYSNKYSNLNNRSSNFNEMVRTKGKIGSHKNPSKKVRANARIRPEIVLDSFWKFGRQKRL